MELAATLPLAALAVAIEACLGYPQGVFRVIGHPVTWIGRLIALTDRSLNHADQSFAMRRALGFVALILVLAVAGGSATLIGLGLAPVYLPVGFLLTALIASSLIAQRCLHAHVAAVAAALPLGLKAGRAAVGKIVGRDVETLDEAGIARAAIESLAENFSDGVVAPAFWLAVGGLPGGFCYKAINTADSMIGHRTARFAAFGFAAAKLDDVVNFIPARLSSLFITIAAWFVPGASSGDAWHTLRKDSRGHASPNAGWPEAAFAGALGLRLGGPRLYGEAKVEDSWIGAGTTEASSEDIQRALALYRSACAVHWSGLALVALLIWQA